MSLRTSLLLRLFPLMVRRDLRVAVVRHGSGYGGWWIPRSVLKESSVAYLAGVGEDISFDVALMELHGCRVVGIDPTPRAAKWVADHAPHGYQLVRKGVAGFSGSATFHAPANRAHVSHSLAVDHGRGSFQADVLTVQDLMAELGDDEIDLLKLDIEGAQHGVLRAMLASHVRPRIVCVEFDQPEPIRRSLATISLMRSAGYGVVKVEGFNVSFLRRMEQA